MRKLTALIMVLGLAAGARAGTELPLCDNQAADDVPLMVSSVTVVGTPSDDELVCIVYLEPTDVGQSGPAGAFAKDDTIRLLPNTTTLVSLGILGLFYRRRNVTGLAPASGLSTCEGRIKQSPNFTFKTPRVCCVHIKRSFRSLKN